MCVVCRGWYRVDRSLGFWEWMKWDIGCVGLEREIVIMVWELWWRWGCVNYCCMDCLLWLSYNRSLRMISEGLQLCIESDWVSHSWCMCIVSRSYGGLGGALIEVVDVMHEGESQGGWLHVGRCQSASLEQGGTLMTPDQISVQMCRSG